MAAAAAATEWATSGVAFTSPTGTSTAWPSSKRTSSTLFSLTTSALGLSSLANAASKTRKSPAALSRTSRPGSAKRKSRPSAEMSQSPSSPSPKPTCPTMSSPRSARLASRNLPPFSARHGPWLSQVVTLSVFLPQAQARPLLSPSPP